MCVKCNDDDTGELQEKIRFLHLVQDGFSNIKH